MFRLFLISLVAFVGVVPSQAVEKIWPAQSAFFESKIRPVLAEYCYKCHSAKAKKLEGGLSLDSRAGMLKGGEIGAAIVPGHPDRSRLITAVSRSDPDLQMPPKKKLPAAAIDDLQQWVKMGAPWPGASEVIAKPPSTPTHWSLLPLRRAELPAHGGGERSKTRIDDFIEARLREAGIEPTGQASKYALIRRLSIDLVGQVPSPGEVDAFVNDRVPDVYARLVDKLLASPQFGERWGRHWLDVVRYADSCGGGGNLTFDEAWRYRDYVIRCFNQDNPYNEFVMEQVAGDLLEPRTDEGLIATGFLVLGEKELYEYDKEKIRMDIVDEQIDTVGRVFLGLTLGCARCHDHKFDPISKRDYYALAGIFRSTQTVQGKDWIKVKLKGGGSAIAVRDDGEPADCQIRIRGDARRLGESVPRGFVRAVATDQTPSINPQ